VDIDKERVTQNIDQRPPLRAEVIVSYVIDACAGDSELVQQMVDFFLNSAANLHKEMETGLAEEDFSVVQRAAHSLKSSSRMFSAETLANLCTDTEGLAVAGERVEIARRLPLIQAEILWLEVALPPFCAELLQ